MAIVERNFLQGYMMSRRLQKVPDTQAIYSQVQFSLDTVAMAHANLHPWEFREVAIDTITSTAEVYLESSNIAIFRSISMAGVGELQEIDGHRYARMAAFPGDLSDTPRKVWFQQNRAYPFRLPSSGLTFEAWGIAPITTAAAVLSAIPATHENALRLAIDYERAMRPKRDYDEAVAQLWGEENNERREIMRGDDDLVGFEDMIGT